LHLIFKYFLYIEKHFAASDITAKCIRILEMLRVSVHSPAVSALVHRPLGLHNFGE